MELEISGRLEFKRKEKKITEHWGDIKKSVAKQDPKKEIKAHSSG
jgi:predicted SnoaL-like aldol condensation-catalyzing enzyme